MFTDTEKKYILFESFNIILPNFEECKYQLTYAIGMMFKYEIGVAFQMWEKALSYYEKSLNKEGEYSEFLCERILSQAIESTSAGLIAEHIIYNNYIKTIVFGKNSYIGRASIAVIVSLLKRKKFETAEELISLAFSIKEHKNFNQSQIIYYIIQELNYEDWEASEEFIKGILKSTRIDSTEQEMINSAFRKKMWQRANESPLTKRLIDAINYKDFIQADNIFNELVSTMKFDLESVFYHVIQSIKINEWMECDFYIYELLKRSNINVLSEKLQKAIEKKVNLKTNRLRNKKK